jgi:hypothetical protein
LDSTAIPRTYWLEGGLIGGAIVGTFGALLFLGLDQDSHGSHVGVAVGGFITGGVLVGFPAGALVGGLFPKQ